MRNGVRDQRGITGLETAIVLIAFVVVSSVFAFAVLSVGLFSSERSEATFEAGLTEARGTAEVRGSVFAEDTGSNGTVDRIYFQITNAVRGEPIDLTVGKTVVRYSDPTQTVIFDTGVELSVTGRGNADSDYLLEAEETYEIALLDLTANLTTPLQADTTFTIEILPPKGAAIHFERTTPQVLQNYNDLK